MWDAPRQRARSTNSEARWAARSAIFSSILPLRSRPRPSRQGSPARAKALSRRAGPSPDSATSRRTELDPISIAAIRMCHQRRKSSRSDPIRVLAGARSEVSEFRPSIARRVRTRRRWLRFPRPRGGLTIEELVFDFGGTPGAARARRGRLAFPGRGHPAEQLGDPGILEGHPEHDSLSLSRPSDESLSAQGLEVARRARLRQSDLLSQIADAPLPHDQRGNHAKSGGSPEAGEQPLRSIRLLHASVCIPAHAR